jgi:hypothetical protein
VGLAAACGTVPPPTDDDDAPAPDGGASALVATTPADGAIGVSVLADIELTFDGPVDAAALEEIAVYERESRRSVPIAEVTVEGEVATIRLARPLRHGTRYRVELPGAPAFRFDTVVNATLTHRNHDAQGSISSRTDYLLDAAGWVARYTQYAAGPDQVFDTPDDEVAYYYRYTTTDGLVAMTEFIGAPGPDGVWLTGDDEVGSTYTQEHSDAGPTRYTERRLGAVFSWTERRYDAQHREVEIVGYDGPGADDRWQTADDEIQYLAVASYDGPDPTGWQTFFDPGPDGAWRTDDDVVGSRTEYDVDEVGRLWRTRAYDAAGVLVSYVAYGVDEATGLISGTRHCTGAGPDGAWFTSDDLISSVTVRTYDATGRRVAYQTRDAAGALMGRTTYDLEH